MRALSVVPRKAGTASLDEVEEPPLSDGPVLVETRAVGVCGTDMEILSGGYGWAPAGKERLIIGHESLGRVLEAPSGCGLSPGDLVVGIVRRPDPVPCAACDAGEWDFCSNGRYTERGIKERDGYCSERYRILPEYAVKVDSSLGSLGVLLEPASVVAKAWEQIEHIGQRATWSPRRAVVTGAGPIGLLAAMMGVQKGLEVHVVDRVTSGPKPDLVTELGAHYSSGGIEDVGGSIDVVLECTGVGQLVFDAMGHVAPGAVVCLTGVSSGGRMLNVDAGALNTAMVLENEAVVGSVNANRRHYESGAQALANASSAWLEKVVSRRVPLDRWQEAVERHADDVKVVIEPTGESL
ncbi:MAG: glucose 1-dehydrogenase [Actinomycetota bacterium]|nr:glucose 1-dehydrogenase [Actinomycetota bacterium]